MPAAVDDDLLVLQEVERRRCLVDPVYFIHTYCVLQADTGAGLVPFRLFDYQADLLTTFQTHRQVIVLKARQLGVTELVAAYAVWKALSPYQTIVAISQGKDEASEIVRKARLCWEHLPPWLRPAIGNPGKTASLEFAHGSRILPKPATQRAGRSFAAQLLILDEWAQQVFAEEIYAAAAPAASAGVNQLIGISTANGVDNLFHRQWLLATEGRGMHPVFLPWHSRPGRDAAWYDRTTETYTPAKKAQEFPSTPDEAFVGSGRPVFDQAALSGISAGCLAPGSTTVLGAGTLRIWEQPMPNRRYVVGADTAEGLAHGDYSAAVVMDYADGTEVAELHGHWPPEVYAAHLAALATRYNRALLGVERNNHGHAVLLALTALEHYTHLYRHVEYDRVRKTASQGPIGWQTSSKSKPIMIDGLATAIREGRPFRNRAFVAEARTYAVLENGDMGAQGALFDDRVVAYGIAEQLRKRSVVSAYGAVGGQRAGVVPYRLGERGSGINRFPVPLR